MQREFQVVSRPLSSRTGQFQVLTQIAQTAAQPRKRPKPGLLTELGFDWVMALIIACSVCGFAGIFKGLPAVLRAHGL